MSIELFLNHFAEIVVSLGVKLLKVALLLIIGLKLSSVIKKWIKKSPRLDKVDAGVRLFLSNLFGIAFNVLLFISVAMILGIPTTSFITVLASCGVAIGLALQGALSNFAGGILILLSKPFKVGDFITAAGENGTVSEISLIYTVLITPDNKHVTVPNGTITSSVITNYSSEKTRRVDLTFNTAYSCDIDHTKAVIEKVIASHPMIMAEPGYTIRLAAHGDSALTYNVRVWCESANYWTVYYDLCENVKKAFDSEGIEIPFPQVDVHVNTREN